MADKEDIVSLVEQTLSVIESTQQQTDGYKIDLEPTKSNFTLEDEEDDDFDTNKLPTMLSDPDMANMQLVSLNSEDPEVAHAQPRPDTQSSASGAGAAPTATQFHGATAASEITAAVSPAAAGGTSSEQRAAAGPTINIWIKDPEKSEGLGALGLRIAHWDYVIRVDSTLPGLAARGMEVRRRFNEFDALHKLLHVEFRGCFIPPLPPKSFLIENTSEEFLRLRRADLQAFLRAVAAHPMLQQSEALRVFLLQPGDLTHNPAWLTLAAPAPVYTAGSGSGAEQQLPVSPAGSSSAAAANLVGNLVSWVRKQGTKVVFQPPQRELSPDEAQLRQSKELLEDLARLLELATQSARTLCMDMDKMSLDCRELGINMGMLSKYEEAVQSMAGQYTPEGHSASNRAADFQLFAKCNAQQYSVWKTMSLKAAANLVTLRDHFILVPEGIRALEAREQDLAKVMALEEELGEKRGQLQQLESSGAKAPGTAERQAHLLGQAISSLEEQLGRARAQYETVKQRNRTELSRLGLEREVDFRRMMSTFASSQAALVQQSADLWAALTRQLAASAVDAGATS